MTLLDAACDVAEVPKPPSEVSSLDRDGENLDEVAYVYETDDEDDLLEDEVYEQLERSGQVRVRGR